GSNARAGASPTPTTQVRRRYLGSPFLFWVASHYLYCQYTFLPIICQGGDLRITRVCEFLTTRSCNQHKQNKPKEQKITQRHHRIEQKHVWDGLYMRLHIIDIWIDPRRKQTYQAPYQQIPTASATNICN